LALSFGGIASGYLKYPFAYEMTCAFGDEDIRNNNMPESQSLNLIFSVNLSCKATLREPIKP
jgi:hypothetical protein